MSERMHKKLLKAGLFPRVTARQLIGLCWFSASGCVVLVFLAILAMGSPGGDFRYTDPLNIFLLLGGAAGGYVLPQFVLSRKVRTRQEQVLTNLPYSIDIL